VEKIKKRRADGTGRLLHTKSPTRRHVGSSEFDVFNGFVCYIIWKTTDRDTNHVRKERGRHALGPACGDARRFKRRRRRFRFQKFFAYFYRLVLCYPPPHLRPTGTHFFILETEIYTYIRSCTSRIDIVI